MTTDRSDVCRGSDRPAVIHLDPATGVCPTCTRALATDDRGQTRTHQDTTDDHIILVDSWRDLLALYQAHPDRLGPTAVAALIRDLANEIEALEARPVPDEGTLAALNALCAAVREVATDIAQGGDPASTRWASRLRGAADTAQEGDI